MVTGYQMTQSQSYHMETKDWPRGPNKQNQVGSVGMECLIGRIMNQQITSRVNDVHCNRLQLFFV